MTRTRDDAHAQAIHEETEDLTEAERAAGYRWSVTGELATADGTPVNPDEAGVVLPDYGDPDDGPSLEEWATWYYDARYTSDRRQGAGR